MRSRFSWLLALLACTSAAVADSQVPSIPDNVQASSLGGSSIRVTWNRPWDDTGVDGYNVYRNGAYLTTVSSTNFVDNNGSSSHRYSIVAFDAARNFSPRTADVTPSGGNTASSPAPAPASSGSFGPPSSVSASALDSGRIQVSWNAAGGDVAGYNVYRDNNYVTTVRGSTSYTDTGLSSGRNYRYEIVTFSNSGQFSTKSNAATANTGSGGSSTASAPSNDSPGTRGFAPAGYRQVFADEFRGNSIDSSKWNTRYRWGPNWIINNEQQYYVDTVDNPGFGHSPFEFDGEHLTITASRTPGHLYGSANSQSWLSGAMTTFGKFKMRYGYVEMRARMPAGQGLWPAFWLLHQHDHDRKPEIDVVEMLGRDPNTVYQTYHYFENYQLRSTPSFTARDANYSADFHTYGMRWEPGRIIWYVDGRETNRFEDGNVSWEEMYLLVNLAVGGAWAGSADGRTPSPSRFTIDYIRAYTP